MRKGDQQFYQWAQATSVQRAQYEEEKNKDYTRHFKPDNQAIISDFRRQNYFLNFQTKQVEPFSEKELSEIQGKILAFTESDAVTNLISAIGGQAFQAPLNTLEFLSFKHENAPVSLVAKLDIAVYFKVDDELRYINLNFAYAIKNIDTDKNFLLDESDELQEISDSDCQRLSTIVNEISNELQSHLGTLIQEDSPMGKLALAITHALEFPKTNAMSSLLLLIEEKIRVRISELFLRPLKPILAGGDHMAFFRHWSHLQMLCPSTNEEEIKKEWAEQHKLGDILIIRETMQWHAYRINEAKTLEIWDGIPASLLENLLWEITPNNVEQYDYAILRDLLGVNTRAVRQIELFLAHNSQALHNTYHAEETLAIQLNRPMNAELREQNIGKIFSSLLAEELCTPGIIRDKVSMKKLKNAVKYLRLILLNPSLLKGLSEAEFLQWTKEATIIFFEHVKQLRLNPNARVQDFYKAQFLPKIERARNRIFAKRRKWLSKILKMDLNPAEISRFLRDLTREAYKVFMTGPAGYERLEEVFYSLYAKTLSIHNDAELDELLHRIVYMKMQDPMNSALIEIILQEMLHIKIRQENNWTPQIADLYRTKSSLYLEKTRKIVTQVKQKIKMEMIRQNEEREKALIACDELRLRAEELLKFKAESEHYVAGRVMSVLADDLTRVILDHYKSHFICVEVGAPSRAQTELFSKIDAAIDVRINHDDSLKNFEGLALKIKRHVLHFFLAVFTLGIFPLARKFLLKKPAFFGSVKNEIAAEAKGILSQPI